jgi:aromatic ring-cleaving dioxygenase
LYKDFSQVRIWSMLWIIHAPLKVQTWQSIGCRGRIWKYSAGQAAPEGNSLQGRLANNVDILVWWVSNVLVGASKSLESQHYLKLLRMFGLELLKGYMNLMIHPEVQNSKVLHQNCDLWLFYKIKFWTFFQLNLGPPKRPTWAENSIFSKKNSVNE